MRVILAICRWLMLIVLLVAGFWFVNYIVKYTLYSGLKKDPQLFIGNLSHAEPFHSQPEDWLKITSVQPNCGLLKQCPHNHVAISIATHLNNLLWICVAGKVVIQKDVNNGGRGINIVVIDTTTLQPINVKRFDTYEKDSVSLENFLQRNNNSKNIFVLVSHDEASKNLSNDARKLITQLGSGNIQNLGFRDHWYMIGQFGMTGFTPFEKYLGRHYTLSQNLTDNVCVPKKIIGQMIQPDPSPSSNIAREQFCRTRPHLEYFCAGTMMRDPVTSCETVGSRALIGSPLLSAAILVISEDNLQGLALTLETLAAQPGLKSWLVTVVYDPQSIADAPELCKLFGFKYLAVEGKQWPDTLELGLKRVIASHSSSEYLIIIEEGLMLSPDYFSTMASLLPLLSDPYCMTISAWNPNGYSGINTRSEMAYRVNEGPGLAFIVTWKTATHHIMKNIKSCCKNKGWTGWPSWIAGGWVAVPEVSRVLMRPSYAGRSAGREQLFGRLRRTSVSNTEILGSEELRGDRYIDFLTEIVSSGSVLSTTSSKVHDCAMGRAEITLPHPKNTSDIGSAAVILPYREQSNGSDGRQQWAGLTLLSKCFGLFHTNEGEEQRDPMGIWRGMLRFSVDEREIMLISNRSPLFSKVKNQASAITLP